MPRKKTAQDAREALYRGLILEAAEPLFAEKGIDATKMDEIAEGAGLALGTVYSVFRGKSAIADGLHETHLGELISQANAAARDLNQPLDMLIAGIRAYVLYFLAHPDYLRIHLDLGQSWGLPVRGGSPRAAAWEKGHRHQVDLIERGIEEETFYADDPSRLANHLAAMQQIRLAEWVVGGMKEDPESIVASMELHLRRAFCRKPEDRGDAPERGN